jgi:hypothetical protein
MRYWIESEDLCSANEAGNVWRGRPDGHSPVSVALLPGSDDAIVLLYVQSGPRNPLGDLKKWPNLVRVRPDGTVVWRASAGQNSGEGDWWVSVDVKDDDLRASTWSCHRCKLDPQSGSVLSSVFTK